MRLRQFSMHFLGFLNLYDTKLTSRKAYFELKSQNMYTRDDESTTTMRTLPAICCKLTGALYEITAVSVLGPLYTALVGVPTPSLTHTYTRVY